MPINRPEWETIELIKRTNPKEGDKLVITRQEVVNLKDRDAADINQLEASLIKRLRQQVDQIKALKEQARQTRELILRLRANRPAPSKNRIEKAGSTDPAPVCEESQSPSAVVADPR